MSRTSAFASQRPRTYLGLVLAAGFLVAVAVPWLLVAALNAVPDKTVLAVFDDRVANWLNQSGTSATDSSFHIISLFGDWLLAVVVIASVVRFAMRRQSPKIAALIVACAGAVLLNLILAFTFRGAHPVAATDFESVAQGVSFPSGHSMVALVAYGMLSFFVVTSSRLSRARQTTFVAATILLVAAIGFARIYLGVHSVSDVALGFVAGGIWLAACIFAYPRWLATAPTPAPSTAELQPMMR